MVPVVLTELIDSGVDIKKSNSVNRADTIANDNPII